MMLGKSYSIGFIFLHLMFTTSAAFSEDCDAHQLYLRCGDDAKEEWFYLINNDRYKLIKVDSYVSSYIVEHTGNAYCGTKYDSWISKQIEYIRVVGVINRTTGRYEPDDYTNVGCKVSSSEEYNAAKRSVEREIELLKMEEQAKDDALRSERAF